MFAQLGSIRYDGALGFSEYTEKIGAIYAEHARIEGKSRLQAVGFKPDEVSITMRLNMAFCSPADEIKKLEDYVASNEVLPLIYGDGSIQGYFVIQDVEKKVMQQLSTGELLDVTLSITLKEYDAPDMAAQQEQQRLNKAFAFDEVKPLPANTMPYAGDATAEVMKQVQVADLSVSSIDNSLTALQQGQLSASEVSRKITEATDTISGAMDKVSGVWDTVQGVQNLGPQLKNNAAQLKNNAVALKQQMPINSVSDCAAATNAMKQSMSTVKFSSSALTCFNGFRGVL